MSFYIYFNSHCEGAYENIYIFIYISYILQYIYFFFSLSDGICIVVVEF